MRIVIVGAGFTGIQLAKLLINEKNQVAIVDNDENTIRHASNQLDCTVMCADGNNLETLEELGIAKADALVCVTSSDEVNMITCSLVDAVYPDILKIARVRNYAYYVNTAKAEKKHSNTFAGKHRPLYGINYIQTFNEIHINLARISDKSKHGLIFTSGNMHAQIHTLEPINKLIFF